MQKITPFLWFNDKAEEAVHFYISLFKNSRILDTVRYDEAGSKASGRPVGSVMTIKFELNGQEFIALNGGPLFSFTEAVSFAINCDSQEEVDMFWSRLTEGGEEQPCGWLKDKYGLSWQVVPTIQDKLVGDSEHPQKAQKAMEAMLQMKKLDIKTLQEAYDQG